MEFLVGEPLQDELDSLRRVEPEPEEVVQAGGLFAELRGDSETAVAVEPSIEVIESGAVEVKAPTT